MSPFRALAVVHLRSTWNRLQRQGGRGGTLALLFFLSVLFVFLVLPLLGSLGVLGYYVGGNLGSPDAPRVIAVAAFVFSTLTLFAGFLGGISSGSRQLPWETLRGFPVRDMTLFAAELFAGAAEAITLVELLVLFVACAGAAVGAPKATPLFLFLFITHALTLLALQQLAGSLAQRLSRRLRALFILLPVAAITLQSLVPVLLERTSRAAMETWTVRLERATSVLPARAVLEAAGGDFSSLAFGLGGTLAFTVLVTVLAFFLVSRERPLIIDTGTGPAAKLWSFQSATWGMARLTWESLVQSLPGRFGLVMPLVTIVLIRGPLAMALSGHAWTAPVAFGYAALAGTNLLFNQFGLDRHGVKVLFLMPVPPEALLRGKLLGFGAWHAVQAAMLTVLLVLTGQREVVELAIGLGLSVCIFLILAMVGQFASIWQPRPLRKNGLRAAQPPLTVVMMIFGTLATAGLVLYGVTFGVRSFFPGWELPVLLGIASVLFALLFPVLAFNALFLERSKEKLVETLGSAG